MTRPTVARRSARRVG